MIGSNPFPSTWRSDTRLSDLELLERQISRKPTGAVLVEVTCIETMLSDIRKLNNAADYIEHLEQTVDA
jgi:hypothetical protein